MSCSSSSSTESSLLYEQRDANYSDVLKVCIKRTPASACFVTLTTSKWKKSRLLSAPCTHNLISALICEKLSSNVGNNNYKIILAITDSCCHYFSASNGLELGRWMANHCLSWGKIIVSYSTTSVSTGGDDLSPCRIWSHAQSVTVLQCCKDNPETNSHFCVGEYASMPFPVVSGGNMVSRWPCSLALQALSTDWVR